MIEMPLAAFARVGKAYPMKPASGWLGELGIMVPGDAGMGMALAKRLAISLASIAIGYSRMSKLRFPEYEGTKIVGYQTVGSDGIKKLAKNIGDMVYYPLNAFGAIGKKFPLQKMGGFLGELGIMMPGAAGRRTGITATSI